MGKRWLMRQQKATLLCKKTFICRKPNLKIPFFPSLFRTVKFNHALLLNTFYQQAIFFPALSLFCNKDKRLIIYENDINAAGVFHSNASAVWGLQIVLPLLMDIWDYISCKQSAMICFPLSNYLPANSCNMKFKKNKKHWNDRRNRRKDYSSGTFSLGQLKSQWEIVRFCHFPPRTLLAPFGSCTRFKAGWREKNQSDLLSWNKHESRIRAAGLSGSCGGRLSCLRFANSDSIRRAAAAAALFVVYA